MTPDGLKWVIPDQIMENQSMSKKSFNNIY